MGDQRRGEEKVCAAQRDMLGVSRAASDPQYQGSLAGIAVLACITPTPQTGVLLLALQSLGAKVSACSDNRFATDDDVVAYLRTQEVHIIARSNMSLDEYFQAMDEAIAYVEHDEKIHIADDGCDITRYIADNYPRFFDKVTMITEQTTCGVNSLKALYKGHKLPVPAININHCTAKQWFDNYLGIKQSLVHSFSNAGISITGKDMSVFGYGAVGKGAAEALRSQGAIVSIVEADLIKQMQAKMEGFEVRSKEEALQKADICITATGCVGTITREMILTDTRDGITLVNIGHGTGEYDVRFLEENAGMERIDAYTKSFTLQDGRKIYSLCEGALFNFIAGGGNPSSVMSLTFTLTLLAHIHGARGDVSGMGLEIHPLPREQEVEAVRYNYPDLAERTYVLSDEQKLYLNV